MTSEPKLADHVRGVTVRNHDLSGMRQGHCYADVSLIHGF